MQRHPELHFSCEKEIHYFYHRYMDPMILSEERRLNLAKTRSFSRFALTKVTLIVCA